MSHNNILRSSLKWAMDPLEEFIHKETSSGVVLLCAVVAALVVANSPMYPHYDHLFHTKFQVGSEALHLSYTLHHWINDGLMALFFFVVGLEVKREILIGELSDLRQALLPIGMALGGMIVPAGVYLFFAGSGDIANGWGIPMATDIAFALGILAILGSRVPKPLVGLLLSIAIVDDIGAVLVIAAFYTDTIHQTSLLLAGLCFGVLAAINLSGIRHPLPYIIFGLLMWLCMMKSGVHATLAGVLTALAIPARSSVDSISFTEQMKQLTQQYAEKITAVKEKQSPRLNVLRNAQKQKLLQSMENCVHRMESPLQRMEHGLHGWVAFIIVPIFAFANAGIPLDLQELPTLLTQPLSLGIIFGLVVGKTIGIFGFGLLVTKTGMSRLPVGVTYPQITGIAMLAGIGFTMSIFIGSLAFANMPELLVTTKVAILTGSIVAGVGGYSILLRSIPRDK